MRAGPSGDWCSEVMSRSRVWAAAAAVFAMLAGAPAAFAASVDYGPISHSGMKNLGAASTSLKLPLQLGLIVSQTNLQNAVKAASNPSSSSYGKYPSLSTLQSKYGASSSKRNAVVNAFKAQGITATVDVTRLRVSATVSVSKAQKLFGTKWNVYKTSTGSKLALPVNTPKLPSGISGNVDTVAGMNVQLSSGSSTSAARVSVVADGGTPTRTGTPAFGCVPTMFPSAMSSNSGLYPNQILTAYGIAPLQAAGLKGQGARVAIIGEAPTPAADVNTFRSCFGAQGTALKIHNAGSIKPILESSLDAMTVSMVAPALANFDLWVHPISTRRRLPGACCRAAAGDDERDAAARCDLGVLRRVRIGRAAGHRIADAGGAPAHGHRGTRHHDRRRGRRLRLLGVRARRKDQPAHVLRQGAAGLLAGSSPWVLSVGGTNLTLNADNTIASSGAWNDTAYPAPFQKTAGGGGGSSAFEPRPWWQPAQSFASSSKRMVPDIAAFADESPGYPIVCSSGVQSCTGSGQSIAYVGGTSAAAPLVAGMIALWNQQARNQGLPRPGFVPPLLTALAQHSPSTFLDITQGTNALFGGSCCPTRTGFDLATGWGSPMANVIASNLQR